MQMSARLLGKEYGLTAEEMNCVLLKLGFLTGEPGDYSLTEKAMQYAIEKEFHRGTGGYSWYNRYWTTRTYDDSIKEVLNVTDELVCEVRSDLAAKRLAKAVARAAAKTQAETEFLSKQTSDIANMGPALFENNGSSINWKKVAKVGFIAGGVLLAGYGIYRLAPKVKSWWKTRKEQDNPTDSDNEGEGQGEEGLFGFFGEEKKE